MRTSLALLLLTVAVSLAQEVKPLDDTAPFTQRGDLSAQMVEGIDRWLERETALTAKRRNESWQRAAAGDQRESFVAAHREKLRQILGATDARTPGKIEEVVEAGDATLPSSEKGFSVSR